MKLKWVVKDLLNEEYALVNEGSGGTIASIQGYWKGSDTNGKAIYSYQAWFLDSGPIVCSDDLRDAMKRTEIVIEHGCARLLGSIGDVPDFDIN
jgi:hypothetical protein